MSRKLSSVVEPCRELVTLSFDASPCTGVLPLFFATFTACFDWRFVFVATSLFGVGAFAAFISARGSSLRVLFDDSLLTGGGSSLLASSRRRRRRAASIQLQHYCLFCI